MKQQMIFFGITLVLLFLFELYTYRGLSSLTNSSKSQWILLGAYLAISLLGYYGFFKSFELVRNNTLPRGFAQNLITGFAFVLIITKIIFASLLVVQDAGRFLFGMSQSVLDLFSNEDGQEGIMPDRRKVLTWISVGIAAIPFASMMHGITRGKYNYSIENLSLKFKDLPKDFDGFRILQISDIHSGSWDDFDSVAKGFKLIQDQNPDMIVFTGDLVNSDKEEINPYMDLLKNLSAPYGKFAILGNHDYYGQPRDPSQKLAYWNDFLSKYATMGFDLIMNNSRQVERNGSSFKLIGVENWGHGRWFPKKGDLDVALSKCKDDDFCVLLSHDPTHWDQKVLPHDKHIHLTLSGHTHGMQFGINIPGFKWSPIKYRYKHWMGLYTDDGQHLYINRGFGFLGFPGRVGMWPEITVIELKSDLV